MIVNVFFGKFRKVVVKQLLLCYNFIANTLRRDSKRRFPQEAVMKNRNKLLTLCLTALCLFSFLVPSFAALAGDADGDGVVSPGDARLILRYAVRLE